VAPPEPDAASRQITALDSIAPVLTAPRSQQRWGDRVGRAREQWPLAILVAPSLVLLLVFYVLPNILTFVYSLTDWSSFKTAVNFVGLDNFAELARDGIMLDVTVTTLKFAAFATIVQNLVALALALALEKPTALNLVLRSIFFLPVLLSTLAAGYIAIGILQTDGLVNAGLSLLTGIVGLPAVDTSWLGSPDLTIFVVGLVFAWKSGGILMLIYIAGLKAIPGDLVEAARIDGAGPWSVIRKVKIPLLAPAFTFNIGLTLIGALGVFDVILAMTKGGPARSTEVINFVVWKQFGAGFFGYSTAISLVLTIAIVLIAIPIIIVLRRREVQL
jgi:raffinose/stachyose/melibiose transport system permease protein